MDERVEKWLTDILISIGKWNFSFKIDLMILQNTKKICC
jgi:hypothetical protein